MEDKRDDLAELKVKPTQFYTIDLSETFSYTTEEI
jgi:hypothetical protein